MNLYMSSYHVLHLGTGSSEKVEKFQMKDRLVRWSFTAQFITSWFKSGLPRSFFQLWLTGFFPAPLLMLSTKHNGNRFHFKVFRMSRPEVEPLTFRLQFRCPNHLPMQSVEGFNAIFYNAYHLIPTQKTECEVLCGHLFVLNPEKKFDTCWLCNVTVAFNMIKMGNKQYAPVVFEHAIVLKCQSPNFFSVYLKGAG